MRTAIVSHGFIGRFADKKAAKEAAKELGVEICHLLLQNKGLQATFGFALVKNGEILGLDPTEYSWV